VGIINGKSGEARSNSKSRSRRGGRARECNAKRHGSDTSSRDESAKDSPKLEISSQPIEALPFFNSTSTSPANCFELYYHIQFT
jgi:hypothetical protein